MGYTPLITGFLLFIIISYYTPLFAKAQISDTERCDAEICHVNITKDGFVPKTLTVKIGSTVIWTNTDDRSHTVTSGSPGEITLSFNSKLLNKNETYEFTFEYSGFYKGKYQYFDQNTGIMRGEIVVEPATAKTEETTTKVQTIKVDFTDPKSGIKNVSLSSGNITSMEINPDLHSLIITLQNVQIVNKLGITLDRKLIDVKIGDKDGSFIVLADGDKAVYDETSSTPTERGLKIVVPAKTTHIEIVGTQVSTEFLGVKDANNALSDVEKFITAYKDKGIILSSAESKLAETKKAFDSGKYAEAEMLANETKTIADNTIQNASIASKALTGAETAIKESEVKGFDVLTAKQLFNQAEQEYSSGNYDKALSLAEQAKTAALNARIIGTSPPAGTGTTDQTYVIAGVVAASAGGAVGAAVYMRARKSAAMERMGSQIPSGPIVKERRVIDLNKIFSEKPYLRPDDKDAINYIAEQGGEAFESEIREKFNLPRTTAWRLAKRLEREGLVEVKKAGSNNLIRIRQEFTTSDQSSAAK